MKLKLFISLFLSLQTLLSALPELNPAAPALLTEGVFIKRLNEGVGLKFGYVGDFTYNRRFELLNTNAQRTTSTIVNAGMLTLNFCDRVDIYGSCGTYSYDTQYDIPVIITDLGFPVTGIDVILKSKTTLHWGVGIKGVLLKKSFAGLGTTYVGANIQYGSATRTSLRSATSNGENLSALPTLSYTEHTMQYSLGIAHKIKLLAPYIGAYWCNDRRVGHGTIIASEPGLEGVPSAQVNSNRLRQHIGWFLGVSLLDVLRMNITAEARFLAGSAVAIAGEMRF